MLGYILADLHFGAIDPEDMLYQLTNTLLVDEPADYVIIAGDLFDTKEFLSSITTKAACEFIILLIHKLLKEDGKIILINGTRTHDNLQLDTFPLIVNKLEKREVVMVVDTVRELELGDLKILCVPEEYLSDKDAYYKDFFNKTYDMVVGHGMVDVMHYADANKKVEHLSSPVFKLEELLALQGEVFFGHVHTHATYKERFHYIGPFTRWEFGNMTKAGYYKVINQGSELSYTFIENHLAKVYPTTSVVFKDKEYPLGEVSKSIQDNIQYLYSKYDNVGRVRLIVKLYENVPNSHAIRKMVSEKMNLNPTVKILLELIEDETVNETQEESETDSTVSYLYDHSINISQRIQEFIKAKSGRNIPLETIENIII